MKRLMHYLEPHKWVMTLATILVVCIIGVELYRPIIIGNTIDNYINGYAKPRVNADGSMDQMFLYEDHYYMAYDLTEKESELLTQADVKTLKSYVDEGASLLTREELKILRHDDYVGIIHAALMFLLMLFLGFVLNALDTWILQKMGQKIIYRMREEAFSHIQSLSLNFLIRRRLENW